MSESLFRALAEYVMVHGGPDRHDFLIGLGDAEKLEAAATEINAELGVGEWTERSRARLNNALLDVENWRGSLAAFTGDRAPAVAPDSARGSAGAAATPETNA